jgi:hypothetical protein
MLFRIFKGGSLIEGSLLDTRSFCFRVLLIAMELIFAFHQRKDCNNPNDRFL